MSITVLIVGLGQIGMGYDLHLERDGPVYTHARAYSRHPDFQLLGGVDPDAQLRETFSRNYGCPAYADVAAALALHQPDLVVIAVPTQFHGPTLQWVLDLSRPKMILCEKPLAYHLQEARAMEWACAERGVKLYVNYMRRSDPGVIEIKRRMSSDEFGVPVKGVVWYSKGFFHNGSHFFNLLEYWLGPMQSSLVLNSGRLWDGADPEPDVAVTFERGQAVFLAAWEDAFSHYTVELLSPRGRLRYEQEGKMIQWQPAQPDPHFKGYTVLSGKHEIIESGMHRYQWHVAEQLARALRGQDATLCAGTDALQTLASMQQIIEGNLP
jgi:predicted dehydrogenase